MATTTTIKERLDEDIRSAMRARNQERLDTLRFLKSQIQLTEKNRQQALDDAGVTDVVAKQAKDRRESIRMFGDGGRPDLVAKEEASLAVLQEYLPEHRGFASSLMLGGGWILAGLTAIPLSLLGERIGMLNAFWVIPAVLLAGLVLALALQRRRPEAPAEAA